MEPITLTCNQNNHNNDDGSGRLEAHKQVCCHRPNISCVFCPGSTAIILVYYVTLTGQRQFNDVRILLTTVEVISRQHRFILIATSRGLLLLHSRKSSR